MKERLSPAESTLADRRRERRRRTLLSGRVTFHNGTHVFDCTIRDLNARGARITMPTLQLVPTRVFLINLHDRLVYDASVVWNRGGEGGVKFQKTMQLDELAGTKLDYLVDLCR